MTQRITNSDWIRRNFPDIESETKHDIETLPITDMYKLADAYSRMKSYYKRNNREVNQEVLIKKLLLKFKLEV